MVDTVYVERSGGGGGLGSLVLLGAVGIGGYFLWKYLTEDGSSEPPPTKNTCQNIGVDEQCVNGTRYVCQDVNGVKKFMPDGTTCSEPVGELVPCTRCANYGCTYSVADDAQLLRHREECHYSLSEFLFGITRVWEDPAGSTARPVILRYFFCQPYTFKEIFAEFDYATIDDQAVNHTACLIACGGPLSFCGGCCDCYIRINYWDSATNKRTRLAEYRITRKSQLTAISKPCNITTDMIEFELYGRGSFCKISEDPQFTYMSATFQPANAGLLPKPKVCSPSPYNQQIGWIPFLSRDKDTLASSGPHVDVPPAVEAYHIGEPVWCSHWEQQDSYTEYRECQ